MKRPLFLDTSKTYSKVKMNLAQMPDSSIIHIARIDQLSEAEQCNLRKRNLKCVGCGNDVIFNIGKAKNNDGTKRQSHFSHKVKVECDWSQESELHYYVKTKIAEKSQIIIPLRKVKLGLILQIDSIQSEVFGGLVKDCKFTPDLSVIINNKVWWIEIAVTHPCEDRKIKFIKENKINCIEIFLDIEQVHKITAMDDVNKIIAESKSIKVINLSEINVKIHAAKA